MESSLPSRPYIVASGSQPYCDATLACLKTIEKMQDGRLLFDRIGRTGKTVKIIDTAKGNSTAPKVVADAVPKMTLALKNNDSAAFSVELAKSMVLAGNRGLMVDHFARQLANGLTPATYTSKTNAAKPTNRWEKPATTGGWTSAVPTALAAQKKMDEAKEAAAHTKEMLGKLMAAKMTIAEMPVEWKYEVPRLLRDHLTPGSGSDATVKFNPQKTFHCVDDPAMHQRPPAIGLAHELIHAMHTAEGTNLRYIVKGTHKLEEITTTGFAPYQYEAISDNKLRTQWSKDVLGGKELALREKYGRG